MDRNQYHYILCSKLFGLGILKNVRIDLPTRSFKKFLMIKVSKFFNFFPLLLSIVADML